MDLAIIKKLKLQQARSPHLSICVGMSMPRTAMRFGLTQLFAIIQHSLGGSMRRGT